VVDPEADADEAKRLYGISFNSMDDVKNMDAVIVAVAHKEFVPYGRADMEKFFNPSHKTKVLMDLKGIYEMKDYQAPEFDYWRL